ncbi:MAG TPA: ABC transporter ATP-binding protein [Verrucomicrobiae bacterium]|nr:ABC transporter ATP-binding protein [Verrucomicrobiae bacterium]
MKNLVQARGLELVYKTEKGGQAAVGPLNLDIREHEALGIIGESGAGKSTLGFELLGLLNHKNGMRTAGTLETSLRPEDIAFVPQDPLSSLDPLFSIGSHLKEAGGTRETIAETLQKVHLPLENISLRSYPHELSGGMRQRLMIALALLRRPKLLIADEPTSSLDMTLQAEIMKLFGEIRGQGLTFLFITHHVLLAASFCDRLAVMKDGKIVETGTPEEIMERPKQLYTAKLVAAVPALKS